MLFAARLGLSLGMAICDIIAAEQWQWPVAMRSVMTRAVVAARRCWRHTMNGLISVTTYFPGDVFRASFYNATTVQMVEYPSKAFFYKDRVSLTAGTETEATRQRTVVLSAFGCGSCCRAIIVAVLHRDEVTLGYLWMVMNG